MIKFQNQNENIGKKIFEAKYLGEYNPENKQYVTVGVFMKVILVRNIILIIQTILHFIKLQNRNIFMKI